MQDFTFDVYASILRAGLTAGYRFYPVVDWYDLGDAARDGIMLRHDVDRRPGNALKMAQLEYALGIRSSYYFRSLPCSFVPDIIEQIRDMGHEIGYHYEDWHLARYNPRKALALFEEHLARLRALAPVRSIAMHGSPLSRENNMAIWDHHAFADFGVIDAILSFDYTGYVFFTDSGRTFAPSGANLRDYLGNADVVENVRSSADLGLWLGRTPGARVQINVHPERWNDPGGAWLRQWVTDRAANLAKRGLKLARGAPGATGAGAS
jgi:hypothetical protein